MEGSINWLSSPTRRWTRAHAKKQATGAATMDMGTRRRNWRRRKCDDACLTLAADDVQHAEGLQQLLAKLHHISLLPAGLFSDLIISLWHVGRTLKVRQDANSDTNPSKLMISLESRQEKEGSDVQIELQLS
jgi:hypothetical protein